MSEQQQSAEIDGMTFGPMPGSMLPCGCHIRRPDYEAILCAEHLGDMGQSGRVLGAQGGPVSTPPELSDAADAILIDVCCCQGGASRGYERAGFTPYGVDIDPQPRYPYPFHQGDAVGVLLNLAAGRGVLFTRPDGTKVELFDEQIKARHASPPCQLFSRTHKLHGTEYPDLIDPIRTMFSITRQPWVIENVEGAPLIAPAMLCGSMFGLRTYRHRLFESNLPLAAPEHPEHVARITKMGRPPQPGEYMHIVGNFSGVDQGREVMDMPWANRDGLREAIPPAYSEWVGTRFRDLVYPPGAQS